MITKTFTIAFLFAISVSISLAQVSVVGNSGLATDYLGWNATQAFPLQIRHNANQPINIFTNNLIRASFTTNGTFGSGTMQGDGLKIIDPSGGPGNLELWTSSSTQSHIRWSRNGTIQAKSSRFEMIANYNGFWFDTMTGNGRYIFNHLGNEVGRIGNNRFWRVGLNPGAVNANRRFEVFDNFNQPQFRITYATNNNVDLGTNADFQVSEQGNLHINSRLNGETQAVAIGFFDDTEPYTGTFLDVGNGHTRLRKLPATMPKTVVIGYQLEDVNEGPEDYFLGRLDFPEENPECFVLNGEGQWANICEGILDS